MIYDYDLNDKNFFILAMKAYDRPNSVLSEFADDYKRVKYIKRLMSKHINGTEINERLILNHIIVLSNVFGVDFTTRMLFLKLDKNQYSMLKTFLVYLNYLPESGVIRYIDSKELFLSDIPIDMSIAERLRTI